MDNWIANFVKPKIKGWVGTKADLPDNLWHKCAGCEASVFHRDLVAHHYVCNECGHHFKIPLEQRIACLFDDGSWKIIPSPKVQQDPLKFKDQKKYTDRLKDARAKTKYDDALSIVEGTIEGNKVIAAIFNFEFQGGSMGLAVGEAFVHAAQLAVETKSSFITIPASGGARMQEGALSLMQLPRTLVAVKRVKNANLPYIVLLSDPTTGGISASFAMVGDIHLAEPGATIGFAGRRVIEQTVRETLPPGFQTAEYLLDHGMVDQVVPRDQQRKVIGSMIDLLTNPSASPLEPALNNA